MKMMFQSMFFIPVIFALNAMAAPVEIQVHGVKSRTGSIFISLFGSPKAWDDEKPTGSLRIVPVVNGTSRITTDLAPGQYAFFLYHDVDNNGQLQTNVFGYPTEPFAFSNDFKLGMSKPKWDDIRFTVSEKGGSQEVTLN